MDVSNLNQLLEILEENTDQLQEVLSPLLNTALPKMSGKLPLLDKAQLYVLITYAIESLLFSYIRLHGINAKSHPVFQELTRVKQYFEKIKLVESKTMTGANLKLDKQAADRFIKNALAGNDKLAQADLRGNNHDRSQS